MADCSGKTVLVTGGTKGIGSAIAKAFLAAGADVMICGRSTPGTLPEAGGRKAVFTSIDVRDAEQCQRLVEETLSRFGRLDVLVNNAGGSPSVDAATASPRFSESIVRLNLLAPLYMAQAAHAALAQSHGSIINIASIAGRRPSPTTAIYGAAKAGLISLTQSLAQEWAPKLRVNAIIVGLVATEAAESVYGSGSLAASIAQSIPVQRFGSGADIADAVLMLATSSAFITGATLEVHGGGEKPPFLAILAAHHSSSG